MEISVPLKELILKYSVFVVAVSLLKIIFLPIFKVSASTEITEMQKMLQKSLDDFAEKMNQCGMQEQKYLKFS